MAAKSAAEDAAQQKITTIVPRAPDSKPRPKLVPLSSVIQEVNRRELADETPEDEAARVARGRVLYHANIAWVMKTAHKKGLFRVHIGDAGDICSVERAKLAPPQPGSYTIISKGNGTTPSFGTLEALTKDQQGVTRQMIDDFGKILRTKEQEKKIGVMPGNDTVQDLKDRFGKLPVGDDELQEQEELAASQKRRLAEAEAEREQTAVMKEVEATSFEAILEEEKKRERDKKKQKKKKKKKK